VPAPKIISSVLQIVPLAQPRYDCSAQALELITRTAFGQRRKMLRSSLKKINGEQLLEAAGIDPTTRPPQLDIESFCELARQFEAAGTAAP